MFSPKISKLVIILINQIKMKSIYYALVASILFSGCQGNGFINETEQTIMPRTNHLDIFKQIDEAWVKES